MSDQISSVLLDLDGTLIDSRPGILSSCRAAIASLGHDLLPELDLSSVIGPPIEDVMRYLLQPFGDDRIAEAVEAYREDYGARGLLTSELYEGISQQLYELRDKGRRLFLATSKRATFATRILENLKLAELFDGIYGSVPGKGLDHKPELIAHLLRVETLNVDHCIMVGDRKFDIAGAHDNQMKAIGVLWGYGSVDELVSAGADAIIATPLDLAESTDVMLMA